MTWWQERLEPEAVIEALLFASGDPLTVQRLAELTGLEPVRVRATLESFSKQLQDSKRGLELVETSEGFRVVTKPILADIIRGLGRKSAPPLSQAARETLAIILYRQPCTRAEIDAIRGVQSDAALHTLLDRELIREAGRRETPGRPILYATTNTLLEYLGISDLDELPSAPTIPEYPAKNR